MRIWYVEEGGTNASRNASCDLSTAKSTARADSTCLLLMSALRSRPRRVRSVAADYSS